MIDQRQSLSSVLHTAALCLADVEAGRSLSALLARVSPSQRGAVQALSMYAMRHWGLAQAWRSIAMQRRSPSAALNSLIALSLLLLDIAMIQSEQSDSNAGGVVSPQCPLGRDAPAYTPHTVVDQTVRAARLITKAAFAPRLANAVLRRFQREREAFIKAVADNPVARWGYPAWWIDLLRQTYPEQWQSVLSVSKVAPDLVIRVNQRQAQVTEVIAAMTAAGIEARHLEAAAVLLKDAGAIERLPGFAQGWWSVQDISAQRAAPLLAPFDGARVLDACSAPGGKAAHLLELADVRLTAVDHDARRLAMVHDNLARLKLLDPQRVQLVHADIRRSKAWAADAPFDLILADVPCTSSGVVRRHPDIAWLRRESDLEQTVVLQREILDALWPALAPGGKLLLVTCSVFRQEGQDQAQQFLQRHPDALGLPAPGQVLPLASGGEDGLVCGQDGFFYAMFAKQAIEGQA